ncbi:MAG: hypothetical protein LC105_07155 [Chitinophagales bacterium]|nr:hypothetical protein [Chitinophagales bacterium]
MKKGIIFTPKIDIYTEVEKISQLFDLGMDYLILRKQDKELSYWYAYIEQFPFGYESKMLTYDFQLLHDLNLGGFVFESSIVNSLSDKDLSENIRLLKSQNKLSAFIVNDLESLIKYDSKFDLLIVGIPLWSSEIKNDMNCDILEYIQKRDKLNSCLSIEYSEYGTKYDSYICAYDYSQFLWSHPNVAIEKFKNRRNGYKA